MNTRAIYPSENIFLSEKWVAASTALWGCDAETKVIGNPSAEHIRAVFYKKGRHAFRLPIGAYNGFAFFPSKTDQPHRIQRQWLDLAENFLDELQARDYERWTFPPSIQDVRPFQWKGAMVTPSYTFTINLDDSPKYSHAVRKQLSKAVQNGYSCRIDDNVQGLIQCVRDTELRQKLNFVTGYLTEKKLYEALKFLGEKAFRLYHVYDKSGEAVSSRVVLWDENGFAQDWLAGTRTHTLNHGVTQFLIDFVLGDLRSAGCKGFDFDGANCRSVQAYKAEFGGNLQIYFEINQMNLRRKVKKINRQIANKLHKIFQAAAPL